MTQRVAVEPQNPHLPAALRLASSPVNGRGIRNASGDAGWRTIDFGGAAVEVAGDFVGGPDQDA